MSQPSCHVYCQQRGVAMCRTGELEAVKRAVGSLINAQQAIIAGEHANAEAEAREALEAIRSAAEIAG